MAEYTFVPITDFTTFLTPPQIVNYFFSFFLQTHSELQLFSLLWSIWNWKITKLRSIFLLIKIIQLWRNSVSVSFDISFSFKWKLISVHFHKLGHDPSPPFYYTQLYMLPIFFTFLHLSLFPHPIPGLPDWVHYLFNFWKLFRLFGGRTKATSQKCFQNRGYRVFFLKNREITSFQ